MNQRSGWFTVRRFFIMAVALIMITAGIVLAEEKEVTTRAWVICENYVNIRNWPSKGATTGGQLDPCDEIEIDGRTKAGFAHIVAPTDGWVWAGNITFSQPEKIGKWAYVTARTRVACRRWVDGPQVESKPWLINGSGVQVFYMSADWACTSRGYIQTEWLEVEGE